LLANSLKVILNVHAKVQLNPVTHLNRGKKNLRNSW